MKNKKIFWGLILILCSVVIVGYQFIYGESAQIKRNLDDFDVVDELLSSQIEEKELELIEREDYSFQIVDKEVVRQPEELGTVIMVDENGEYIHSFELLQEDEKYIIYMRGIYMALD